MPPPSNNLAIRLLIAAQDGASEVLNSVGQAVGSLKEKLLALGTVAGITALFDQLLGAGERVQDLRTEMEFAAGGTQEFDAAMRDVSGTARDLGLGVYDLADSYIRLKNLGLDPSRQALIAYANIAAASGKSTIDFAEAVADAITGEFERLKEFGIKASANGDQVTLRLRGHSIQIANDARSIEEALIRIGEVDFAGAAVAGADNASAAIDRMASSIDRLVGLIALDSGLIDGTAKWASAVASLADALGAKAVPATTTFGKAMETTQPIVEGMLHPTQTLVEHLLSLGPAAINSLAGWVSMAKGMDEARIAALQLADKTQAVADADTAAAAAAKAQTEQQRMLADQIQNLLVDETALAAATAKISEAFTRSLKIHIDSKTAALDLADAKQKLGIAAAKAAGDETAALRLTAQASVDAIARAQERQRYAAIQVAAAEGELATLEKTATAKEQEIDQLKALVEQRRAAYDQSALAVQAAQQEEIQARLATLTYGDQSAQLNALVTQRDRLQAAIRAEGAQSAAAQPLIAQLAVVQQQVADAARDTALRIDETVNALGREQALAAARADIQIADIARRRELALAQNDEVAALNLTAEMYRQEMNLIRESASAKRDEALLLSQKADAMEKAARATGEYTAEERAAVDAMRDAAEMAGLSAKRMDVDAKAKRDALDATRALANQQRVLSEEFGKVGATGVKTMDDVRNAIENAASGEEIEALGRALYAAFQKGVLSADEYKKALDEVLAKTRDLKEENKSKPAAINFDRLFEQYGTDSSRVGKAFYNRANPTYGVSVQKSYEAWLAAKRASATGAESAPTSGPEAYFAQEQASREAQQSTFDQQSAASAAAAAANEQRKAFRTVRVELVSGGKTTNLDLPEGQDKDLLDAIRRSGLSST